MSAVESVPVIEQSLPAIIPIVASTTPVVAFEQSTGIPADLVGPVQWDHPCAAHLKVELSQNGSRRVVHTQAKRKKVCIVGYAENSRHLAWYNDPECEIWGVNQLSRFIPRADRWFQIHHNWHERKYWAENTDQEQWLKDCPIPVYMISDEPNIPNAVAYPKEWVKAELKCHEYFTSSIAFMLALAIAEGFEEIGIYGIDLIVGREWAWEKPCAEYYLGVAHARGIAYHLPENSALLWQSHTYGYEHEPDYGFYGLEKLRKRARALEEQVAKMREDVFKIQGRLEEADFLRSKAGDEASKGHLGVRIQTIERELSQALNLLYLHDGAQQEVSRMYGILELRSRGGSVS